MDERKLVGGPDRLEILMSFASHRQVDFLTENRLQIFIMVNRVGKVNESTSVWRLEGWTPRDGKAVPIVALYDVLDRTGTVSIGAK